ncbi:MAG: hypothetical protein HQ504_06295 [Rhodospirillaceae bacterium]|nr:hypothetical protein [Rhodospirillaceae bacterium]
MNWFKEIYIAPFRALAVLIDIFTANRDRLDRLMARPAIRIIFRGAVIVTTLAWLVIWLTADPDHEDRLGKALKEMLPGNVTSEGN